MTITLTEAYAGLVLLLPALVYAAWHRWNHVWYLRRIARGNAKRRLRLIPALRPYIVRKTRGERPGKALRRAAYCAYRAGKISKQEMDLFGGGP